VQGTLLVVWKETTKKKRENIEETGKKGPGRLERDGTGDHSKKRGEKDFRGGVGGTKSAAPERKGGKVPIESSCRYKDVLLRNGLWGGQGIPAEKN